MAYVKQICDGYNKKSLMGNWYEERLYLNQPFREQQLKQARQKDGEIVCFDQTGFQKDLPRIQRRSKWVTRGRIILDDGFNTNDTTMKASYPHSELKAASKLTLQPFNKNFSEILSTDLHPHSQIRTKTQQHKMLNQSNITELKRERQIGVGRCGFANTLPKHPKEQKMTNFQSHYNEQFKKPSEKNEKKLVVKDKKAGDYNQNPEEVVKILTTMVGQYKKEDADEKEATQIQRSWVPPKDKSLIYGAKKTGTQLRKGIIPKNDIQTSLNMNIGVHNIHPKNVADNFFGHKKSSITCNTNKNLCNRWSLVINLSKYNSFNNHLIEIKFDDIENDNSCEFMINNDPQENSVNKIIEGFTNEIRKLEIPRKNNDGKEKGQESTNVHNFLQQNVKLGGLTRGSHLLNSENLLIQTTHQATPKQSKANIKLPSINEKRNVILYDKNKEIPRTTTDICKIQAKKPNSQFFETESKQKCSESMDDLASKFMSIRPIKYELSPGSNQDLTLKSLKSVRQKYTFKCESHKQMPAGEERVEQEGRKLKTQGKRLNVERKDWSLVKNQKINQKSLTKEIKSNKLGSASQTVKVVPLKKEKYSINYLDFCMFISLLNGNVCLPTSTGSYLAFVGKGNNSILIKNTLKNRFWWNLGVDSQEDANFYWSQSRDNKFIQSLKGCLPSEGKNQQLKYKYLLERPKLQKEKDRNDIKEFTGQGLWKLMSEDERLKYSKNQYQAEITVDKGFIPMDCANKFRLHNHFEFNWNITNKKALYYNLKKFYLAIKSNPFQFIPLTFHIQTQGDAEWLNFQKFFKEREAQIQKKGQGKGKKKKERNLWIIKPGQNSNQGCGIKVAQTLEEIKQIIHSKQNSSNSSKRSHIIQRYLMPLLYNKRKFDIRCYILVTSINSILKAYWYEEGYIRTSSKDFTLKNLKNRFVHLTNDAVQKKSEDYGKYENGNKVSFADFQKYLEVNYPDYSFYAKAYPRMIKLAGDSIRSVTSLLNSNNRQYTFEIFGLDFMIDDEFNTWLIEVNNNPCLELGCPLLARIIPNMIENAFKIAVDPLFPPPQECPKNKIMASDLFQQNKFTLIFNSQQQKEQLGDYLLQVDPRNLSNIIESDEQEDNHSDSPCSQLKQHDDTI